jgi:hypothetical protein
VPDRRVVIVAPTAYEAEGEADALDVPHAQQMIVTNRSADRLRGHTLTEQQIVRVREDGWSEQLREMVDVALMAGELAS